MKMVHRRRRLAGDRVDFYVGWGGTFLKGRATPETAAEEIIDLFLENLEPPQTRATLPAPDWATERDDW